MNESALQKLKQRYGIIGNDSELNRALDIAVQVAPTDLSVLVTGENGAGKEVLARIIHDNSLRKGKKLLTVNCGSIPEGTIDSELFGHEKGAFTGAIGDREGYFGAADGGTLFLDEVGELPLSTQARLLRVLETGEYIRVGSSEVRKTNVRIVAATNVNIPMAITERHFREDLYYRLNTIPVHIPPLRERGKDVVLLFMKFALEMSEKYGMTPIMLTKSGEERLMAYSWPGNIRQLKNVTENMSITSQSREITPEVLDHYIPRDRQSTELVAVNGTQEHNYANEREDLLKFLFGLREEIKDLKSLVAKQEKRLQEMGFHDRGAAVSSEVSQIVPSSPITQLTDSLVNDTEVQHVDYVEDAYEALSMADIKKDAIERAMIHHKGNLSKVADELKISTRTLYRMKDNEKK